MCTSLIANIKMETKIYPDHDIIKCMIELKPTKVFKTRPITQA